MVKRTGILVLVLAFVFCASVVYAQSAPLESFDLIRDMKKDIASLYKRYLKLEKELQKFEKQSQSSDLQYGVNISLKKKKNIPFQLLGIELHLDNKMVFSDFYNSQKNRAFDKGGRQLLYSGSVPRGRHVVMAKMMIKKNGSPIVLEGSAEGELIVKLSAVAFLEIVVTERKGNLSIQLVNRGHR